MAFTLNPNEFNLHNLRDLQYVRDIPLFCTAAVTLRKLFSGWVHTFLTSIVHIKFFFKVVYIVWHSTSVTLNY